MSNRALAADRLFGRGLVMLGLVVAVLTSSSPRARERPFTLVVMPDVQYYTDLRHKLFRLYWDPPTDNLTHIYTQQLQWVLSTRHRLNTRAVIFMGDLTQADAPEEWAALRTGLRYLEAARPPVPYCLLQGDHDLGYEYTGEYPFMFRKAAHRRSQVDGGVASAVTAQPHWRGAFASTHQASASWASSWANSWYELTTNSSLAPMLVICLECRRRHSNWCNLGPPPSQIPCSLLRCQTGHATRCFGGRQACWGATQGTMPSS